MSNSYDNPIKDSLDILTVKTSTKFWNEDLEGLSRLARECFLLRAKCLLLEGKDALAWKVSDLPMIDRQIKNLQERKYY